MLLGHKIPLLPLAKPKPGLPLKRETRPDPPARPMEPEDLKPMASKRKGIARAVKDLRTRADFTQRELADAIGTTVGSISRYETDCGAPEPKLLLSIAKLASEKGHADLHKIFLDALNEKVNPDAIRAAEASSMLDPQIVPDPLSVSTSGSYPFPSTPSDQQPDAGLQPAEADELEYFQALTDDSMKAWALLSARWPDQVERINILHTLLNFERALRVVNRSMNSKQRG